MYLDDVSVFSLLASRVGEITDSITETQASSLSASGSFRGNIGSDAAGASANAGGELGYTRNHSEQVLRKSTIQSQFRRFSMLERERTLGAESNARSTPPTITTPETWEALLRSGDRHWVIPDHQLKRGRLIELEVDLDSDTHYQLIAIYSTVTEALKKARNLFGSAAAKVDEVEEGVDLLRSLFVGLVPIVARAREYSVVRHGDIVALVHHQVIAGLPKDIVPTTTPLDLVGVTEESLYWLDLRRVLYSRRPYRIMARVGRSNIRSKWTPVKLMDLLSRVDPNIAKKLDSIAFPEDGITVSKEISVPERLSTFAQLAVRKLGWDVDRPTIATAVAEVAAAHADGPWDPDIEMEATNAVLERVKPDDAVVPTELKPSLREQARDALESVVNAEPTAPVPTQHEYLDTEIIAIYW